MPQEKAEETSTIFMLSPMSSLQEETKEMVAEDRNIVRNILKIWKEWRELERTSRREDRCHTPGFKKMEEKFVI